MASPFARSGSVFAAVDSQFVFSGDSALALNSRYDEARSFSQLLCLQL